MNFYIYFLRRPDKDDPLGTGNEGKPWTDARRMAQEMRRINSATSIK